jgi:chorismate mutase
MGNLIKAIRMATTVEEDSVEEIRQEVCDALKTLMTENKLEPSNLVSVFFTLTIDIKSLNPATVARENLGWNQVPMICAHEAFIEKGMQKCIRALLLVSLEEERPVHHIYCKRAKILREDWN